MECISRRVQWRPESRHRDLGRSLQRWDEILSVGWTNRPPSRLDYRFLLDGSCQCRVRPALPVLTCLLTVIMSTLFQCIFHLPSRPTSPASSRLHFDALIYPSRAHDVLLWCTSIFSFRVARHVGRDCHNSCSIRTTLCSARNARGLASRSSTNRRGRN